MTVPLRRLMLICLAGCGLLAPFSSAYPMLAEVPEETQQCLQFNIPKEDDAHMVFVALPAKISWELEDWVMSQIRQMTKNRQADGSLPNRFPEKEPQDENVKKEFLSWYDEEQSLKSSLTLNIHKPRGGTVKEEELLWYRPVVLNHVVRSQRQWEASTLLGGYSICFDNEYEEDYVHVAFDMVLVSEDIDDDEVPLTTKDHLTPLEEQLGESISAAHVILKEMRYMEKREQRMRMTAESIHSKIRLFSYLSVVILLTVTYVQVTYLKRYFKKKKLM